jgi:hypothetical protein
VVEFDFLGTMQAFVYDKASGLSFLETLPTS